MKDILPVLFVLACPLMMIFMMRGMHGGRHDQGTHASSTDGMDAAELRRLREDIDQRLRALDDSVRGVEATSRARYDDAAGA